MEDTRADGPKHISGILSVVAAEIDLRCRETAREFYGVRSLQNRLRSYFPMHQFLELAYFDEIGLPYRNKGFEERYGSDIFDIEARERYCLDIRKALSVKKG